MTAQGLTKQNILIETKDAPKEWRRLLRNYILYQLTLLLPLEVIQRASDVTSSALERNCRWMMLFSLPFLLFYNEKRSKGIKKLFCIYYPAHIYALHRISTFGAVET